MTSINTNTGAMVALQMLGGTTQQKEEVQKEVATGKEVDTAQDNAALWAISQLMDSDVAGYRATSDALALGEATAAVAAVGAERISGLVSEMRELAIVASSGLVDFSKIEEQMVHKTDQIGSIISASQFNGTNLLASDIDGKGNTSLTVTASLDRQGFNSPTQSTITVDSADFEGSASFDIGNRTIITDQASAQTALGELDGFLQFAIDSSAALGAAAARMAEQNDFVGKLADAVTSGIGDLIDTNMEEAAARWAALGAQQQLGTLSLSIANASPGTLQSLY